MVKFFLREQMARLKVQAPLKKQQKKPLDYRLVIYKKMLNLVKAEHSIMIQKLIRKIKQKKTKEVNGKEPHPQISKLNQKFTYLKGIKQQTIREIVIYIMTEVLKLEKMQKVFQKNKLSIELAQLKQKTEGSEAVKYFIQKLSMLTAYQKQLQKSAQLVDTVAEKRVFRKGQLKQRRVQKKIQKKMIKQELNQKPNLTNQKRQVLDQQVGGNLLPRSKLEQFQSKQSRKIKDHKYSKQNLVGKYKPIKKQRTQFKKTGRNKAKQQKLQKKYGNYSSQKARQPQHIHSQSSQKQYFIKKDMHPSWQAKKQLKNQMFIQPFQGKKILL